MDEINNYANFQNYYANERMTEIILFRKYL